jgi:hypothetical protein
VEPRFTVPGAAATAVATTPPTDFQQGVPPPPAGGCPTANKKPCPLEPKYPEDCVKIGSVNSTKNTATVMVGNCFGRSVDYLAAEYTNKRGSTVCDQQMCVCSYLPAGRWLLIAGGCQAMLIAVLCYPCAAITELGS